MSCCGVDLIGGASSGGGAVAVAPLQAATLLGVGVGAAATGSINTTVANFVNPTVDRGTVPIASWLVRTDSATLGTTLKLSQAGRYAISLEAYTQTGGVSGLIAAITYDAPPAMLSANPSVGDASGAARAEKFVFGLPNAQGLSLGSSVVVTVTAADAANPAAGILRAQFSDLSNGPPTVGTLDEDAVFVRIERICE